MAKLRILVVDDSGVIRRWVNDVINGDPALEVVGIAANGRIAQERIEQPKPDLVTMDVEMPEMNGVAAVKELRKKHPRLPVIMFSTLIDRGAAITMAALAAGASDYVCKPANVSSATAGMAKVRDDLIPKIKALCGIRDAVVAKPPPPRPRPAVPAASLGNRRIEILAIGVSTGGPNALAELMPAIPADFPRPIVIVQHMPPVFTRLLAERLSASAQISVRKGVAGEEIKPGVAWSAPGEAHMVLEKSPSGARLKLTHDAPENSFRPGVDPLFRSVVKLYGASTLGVILTGMGQDGLHGCEQIAEAGGQILAQGEASSRVWGMPAFIARAGLADKVMPLSQIAGEITRRAWTGRTRQAAVANLARQ